MLRRLMLLSLGLISVVAISLSSVSVFAVDPFDKADICTTGSPEYNTDFCKNARAEQSRSLVDGKDSLIYTIAQTIVYITAAVSVIMIIIGGFRYVISSGDSNAMSGAKNTILYAVIGLVVALSAQLIVSFVLSRFI
jgi:hypothetical protein